MSASRFSPRRLLPLLSAAAILLVLAGGAAYAYFGVGLRAYVVETPSMGSYAPVGTLVISKPVTGEVEVGETILFRPSGQPKTYFHRVVKVQKAGIATSGDLTHELDPWLLTSKNITGTEVTHIANAGWLFKASPVLLLGALLILLYVRFFSARYWRVPSIFFGGSTVLAVANYMFHPFVQASLLDKSVSAEIATIRFVNTGILPLDVFVNGRSHLLRQGELFVAHAKLAAKGTFAVSSTPHMEWWTIAAFAAVIAAPSIIGFAYLLRNRRSPENWYYVPSKRSAPPEGYVMNVSDQVLAGGRIYPKYIDANYDPDEEAEFWRKTLVSYGATTDSR